MQSFVFSTLEGSVCQSVIVHCQSFTPHASTGHTSITSHISMAAIKCDNYASHHVWQLLQLDSVTCHTTLASTRCYSPDDDVTQRTPHLLRPTVLGHALKKQPSIWALTCSPYVAVVCSVPTSAVLVYSGDLHDSTNHWPIASSLWQTYFFAKPTASCQ